jgi:hypothetical protein
MDVASRVDTKFYQNITFVFRKLVTLFSRKIAKKFAKNFQFRGLDPGHAQNQIGQAKKG